MLQLALKSLGLSAEAMQRGWADVETRTLAGDVRTVRLTVPTSPEARASLLDHYAKSSDARVLLAPMLTSEIARPEFWNSLAPTSLARMANVATGLILGPDQLSKMVEGQFEQARFESSQN